MPGGEGAGTEIQDVGPGVGLRRLINMMAGETVRRVLGYVLTFAGILLVVILILWEIGSRF